MPRDLVTHYAERSAARRNDLRGVIQAHRAGTVLSPGAIGVGPVEGEAILGEPVSFGRGTAEHREAVWRRRVERREARRLTQAARPWPAAGATGRHSPPVHGAWPVAGRRRAAAAVIAALVLVIGAASSALAQARYQVQEGDTIDSVAATFGVDAEAIVAASYIQNYPALTPGEIIVIPDPGQTPEEAASEAATVEGTSPWVVAAYVVEPGDTLGDIARAWSLDAETLAAFNGLEDLDDIRVGQRLLIPPSRHGAQETPAAEVSPAPEPEAVPEAAEASAPAASAFVAGVGTYFQSHNLSCEYAATFIATSAFGAGVPEWVFLEWVPQARNPHYGYRGNIDGWWGNTDDYGVYPEALVPALNHYGFAAYIFYSGGATGDLTWYLDQGLPVVVWLGLWGNTAVTLYDEGTYTVAAGAHVVTVYGYDANGVYISDPATGSYGFYDWGTFTAMWSVLGGMAMAVAPA
jgi:uncharacterized protein YvpB/LysM repeat protein